MMHLLWLCLLIAIPLLAAPPTTWTSRGPGGGGAMYAPTINPNNTNELYLGCDMGPQFHSDNAGARWTTFDFRQLTGGHESAVRCTSDPKIRWALDYHAIGGGDNVRPKRSTDGGLSWHYLPEQSWPTWRTAYSLYADYVHPERAVVSADYKQLWVTLDGGKSFAQKAVTASANGLHLAGCVFDSDAIYAGTAEGVYQSTDGGATFTLRTYDGIPADEYPVSFAGGKSNGRLRLMCVTAGECWAGITGSEHGAYRGVYVQDSGNGPWRKATDGIAPDAHPWFVKMAMNDADTAYLAGGSANGVPTVYKTTDGGAHWTSVFLATGNRNIVAGWAGDGDDFRWSFPEYALGFDVCLTDANRALFTDLGCAHLTTDGGATWTQVYTGLTAPRKPGDVALKGATYRGCGLEVTSAWQIAWLTPKTLVTAATDIKGFRSSDGGATWSFNYSGHDLNTMYRLVKHPATGICYAATSSVHDLYMSTYLQDARIDRGQGMVLLSADNGASWKPLKNFGHPVVWVTLDPTRPNRLYAAVVHSTDGGIYVTDELEKGQAAGWRKLPAPPRTEGHPYNIVVLNDGTLVCSYSGRRAGKDFTLSSGVFVSADGGQSWEDRSDPGMRCWTKDIVVDPADPAQQTWYAGVFHAWGAVGRAGRSGCYRTTDRGKSWTCLADNTLAPSGVLNVESCAFNPNNPRECYLTTEYDGLWYTADIRAAKPVFVPVTSYPFHHPMRVFFNPADPAEMWVTSFGNGLYVGRVTP